MVSSHYEGLFNFLLVDRAAIKRCKQWLDIFTTTA